MRLRALILTQRMLERRYLCFNCVQLKIVLGSFQDTFELKALKYLIHLLFELIHRQWIFCELALKRHEIDQILKWIYYTIYICLLF